MQNMLSIFPCHNSETDIFIEMSPYYKRSWKKFLWLGISKSYSPGFDGRLRNFGDSCIWVKPQKHLGPHWNPKHSLVEPIKNQITPKTSPNKLQYPVEVSAINVWCFKCPCSWLIMTIISCPFRFEDRQTARAISIRDSLRRRLE